MRLVANGFTTELLSGWEDRSIITVVGPTGESGFAANVIVTRERAAAGMQLQGYAQIQLSRMQAELPGLAVLDERQTTLNGVPAYQRLQRFQAQGRRIQQAQTFLHSEDTIFVITCTATVDEFDAHAPAFRHFVESFRLFNKE